MVKDHSDRERGRKEMFYVTTHSTSFNEVLNTFYLRLYGKGPLR